MELVLIRHAQPAWAAPDGTSTNNPGLTDLGRKQAEQVAAWLAQDEAGFDEVCTSPARRTRETVSYTEATLGVTATVVPWLLEIGPSTDWEGQPEAEVVRVLDALRQRPREEWWNGSPGGESFRHFHGRVTAGIDDYLTGLGVVDHPEDPLHLWEIPPDSPRIAMFAHAGTNSVITSHLLGVEPQPWEWERFPCDHASVTVLRSRQVGGGSIWALEYFSDIAHLPADHVTH